MLIDPKLEQDSIFIKELELCQLRLLPDQENPWFILIPKREGAIDWCDLSKTDQHLLTDEINFVCNLLKTNSTPDKLNIGSLGNMVPQLHIHIIARYINDRAWPNAIWGTSAEMPFDMESVKRWSQLVM